MQELPDIKRRQKIPSVPLFLIPKAIQEQIKQRGESIFTIFVKRRLHHQYRIYVETFSERALRTRKRPAKKTDRTVQDVLDV
jgi:hypothetical protein